MSNPLNNPLSYFTMALGLGLAVNVNADNYTNQNPNRYQKHHHWYSAENEMNTVTTETKTTTTTMTDQELAKKIQDKISSGWFSKRNGDVVAKVLNGNVTLTGQVKTEEYKAKIEEEVKGISGVVSINNQITVAEKNGMDKNQSSKDRSSTSADAELNKKIRDKMSTSPFGNSYKDVSLNTTNGVVTLEGTIDTLSNQQKLLNEIQKISGVKSVKSSLRIK